MTSIKDVAAAAGVSATTVSQVLNNVASARVSPETRERVKSAAGELGYGPDRVAQALRTRRTGLLGMVCEDVGVRPSSGQGILGADAAARSRGYNLVVINAPASSSAASRAAAVESLLARRVDGIIYAAGPWGPEELPANLGSVPSVLVGSDAGPRNIPAVVPDEEGGARTAVGCLLAAGHTRIGFLNGPRSNGRLRGFRDALTEAGFDGGAVPVEWGPDGVQGGYAMARRVLEGAHRPTALVCHNDKMAMGAYRAAAELGLAIPLELSLVAFADQDPIAESLHPGLTTVSLRHEEMAAKATETLLDAVEGKAGGALPVAGWTVVACQLVARGSVAPRPDPLRPEGTFERHRA